MTVINYVAQGCPRFIKIRRNEPEQMHRRSTIRREGRQGLLHLMRNRSRRRFQAHQPVAAFALQHRVRMREPPVDLGRFR
jgi:hypothetical protein